MMIIVTGVSGSGKTTIGKCLSQALNWKFYEGDDYHPSANIEKMRQAVPLTDEDRKDWLDALARLINRVEARGENGVLACSALKHGYREQLRHAGKVAFVHLKANEALIRDRLGKRRGHFMNPKLIESQFATLEEPQSAIIVDAALSPDEIVRQARQALGL